ncbi:MAG: oligosaccharide flippase family protein, partial [Methanobacterium sp.]|nr:oligosaccharide flippase family protein [Methanobacterium sp.]
MSAIILLPILTKNLTIVDYGIWVQLIATMGLIPNVTNLGLTYSMVRFFPSMKNHKKEIQEAFYSIFFVVLIVSILVSLGFLLSSKTISILFGNNIVITLILPFILLFTSLNFVFLNFFRTFQQMRMYSLFMLLQSYINLIIAAYLVISGYSIIYVVIGVLITQILIFILMGLLLIKEIGIKVPK